MQYIFIHGLGQNPSSWDKAISFLSETATILCPDLSAMFQSKETTYANLYRSFSDFCSDIPGTLNLCGLSLGAILALNYAIDHPEKMQSIVLITAQYKMPKTLLKLQNIIFRLMPGKSFRAMGFQKHDFIKLTNSMMDLDFSERIKEISCPALIVCGGKDSANKKAARALAASIWNAEFHIVENVGHEVNIEAPEKLASVIETFWRGFSLKNDI